MLVRIFNLSQRLEGHILIALSHMPMFVKIDCLVCTFGPNHWYKLSPGLRSWAWRDSSRKFMYFCRSFGVWKEFCSADVALSTDLWRWISYSQECTLYLSLIDTFSSLFRGGLRSIGNFVLSQNINKFFSRSQSRCTCIYIHLLRFQFRSMNVTWLQPLNAIIIWLESAWGICGR